MYKEILETVAVIRSRHAQTPVVGLILGSGLGPYADTLQPRTVIPYSELPHFPRSTAIGHSGNLVLGEGEGVRVVAMQGRVHFYEGYSMKEVIYPVRVLGALGMRQLMVTNSAGGINLSFRPGDLRVIAEHGTRR